MMIDILNRKNEIDLIYNIIEKYSKNKEYISFAINGEQGVGKSFVVDRLVEKLNNESDDKNNYFVIKYDCWKNDFYEEPIKAILIEIYNVIEENKDNYDEEFKIILGEISKDILALIDKYLENKYNLLHSIIHYIFEKKKKIDETKEKVISQVDNNKNLKILLAKVRNNLDKIAKNKTVIVFVDELDRCLPNYQIKVLERLHHIFNNLKNVQVICIYDKSLIDKTIKNTFGEQTSIDRYMKKFINFNLKLSIGECKDVLFDRFNCFFSEFNFMDVDKEFIKCVISKSKILIREIEKMFENLLLINNLYKGDFANVNGVALTEFEIVIYLIKIMVKKHYDNQPYDSMIVDVKDCIHDIFRFHNENEVIHNVLTSGFISECQKFLSKITISSNDLENNQAINEPAYANLVACKILLAKVFSVNDFIQIKICGIDQAKNILKYLDMFI